MVITLKECGVDLTLCSGEGTIIALIHLVCKEPHTPYYKWGTSAHVNGVSVWL